MLLMRRKIQLFGLIILPMLTSILSVYYKALWLIPVVVILIFVLIGIMPICRKNENLWMFVLTGFCSIPVNVFLLTKFNVWMDYLYKGSGKIHMIALIIGYTIVLTGMEEIVLGLITRVLWKKQCKLYIPVDDDE